MHGSGAVSCSCSLLIRGPNLPAVRQKLHLSPCADSRSRLSGQLSRWQSVCEQSHWCFEEVLQRLFNANDSREGWRGKRKDYVAFTVDYRSEYSREVLRLDNAK